MRFAQASDGLLRSRLPGSIDRAQVLAFINLDDFSRLLCIIFFKTKQKIRPTGYYKKKNQGTRFNIYKKGLPMTDKLDPGKMDDLEQLLISNTLQLDAVTQLLIEKGVFTKEEYSAMVDKVLNEYQQKKET